MKTNNKGYSLVELVMTLGCFSIIMLAIMLMMRTTIATYKDGLIETKKQQEAQIVANQIAEFIIDADSYAGGYSFVKDGVTRSFSLDGTTNTLYYGVAGAADPLSDCITDFTIEGLESATADGGMDNAAVKAKQYDNTCRVKVTISYMDRTYEAVKDVHFRNDIENPEQYSVAKDASTAPGPAPDDGKEVIVYRYDVVNLTKKYDVVNFSIPGDSNVASYYKLTPSDPTTITSDLTGVSGNGIKIECNNTIQGDFDFNTRGKKCTLDCTLRNGSTLKITFVTDPVSLDVPANSVFIDLDTVETNNGHHQDLPVKGIHINEYLKTAGSSVKVTSTFKENGTSQGSATKTFAGPNANVDKNDKSDMWINPLNCGGRICIGVLPNAFSNGLIISTGNDKKSDTGLGYLIGNSEGKYSITFDIEIGGNPYSVTYKYYVAGATLEHAS